jgi:ubiquinone biosynthesis protein
LESISDRILDRELADKEDSKKIRIIGKRLNEGYVHYKRYIEILNIISKHGFGFIFDRIKSVNIFPKLENAKKEIKEYPVAIRLRLMLQELGPTFIKVGQILSTRPDLIPEEYAQELENLRDNVTPMPYSDLETTIETEFGRKIEEIFKNFIKEPVGSASIGQVHLAETKDGKEVAVKVQRPKVKNKIMADMEILEDLAEMFKNILNLNDVIDPIDMINEFKRLLTRELDYTIEARSIEHFRQDFSGVAYVFIPDIYWNLTTKKVLTMDFVRGIPIDEVNKIRKAKIDTERVALNLGQAVARMIFVKGYFHGDPHGGNVFVQSGGRIALLDFGSIGYLDDKTRDKIRLFYFYLARENVSGAVEIFLDICQISEIKINRPALEQDIREFFDYQRLQRGGKKIDKGMNQKLVSIALKHGFMPPPQFILLERALLEAEGVCRELMVNFDINQMLMPILNEVIQEKVSKTVDPIRTIQTAQEYRELLRHGPKKVQSILEKMDSGTLTINVDTSFLKETRIDIWRMFLILIISIIALELQFLIIVGGMSFKTPIFNISLTIIPIFIIWFVSAWWVYLHWKGPRLAL